MKLINTQQNCKVQDASEQVSLKIMVQTAGLENSIRTYTFSTFEEWKLFRYSCTYSTRDERK